MAAAQASGATKCSPPRRLLATGPDSRASDSRDRARPRRRSRGPAPRPRRRGHLPRRRRHDDRDRSPALQPSPLRTRPVARAAYRPPPRLPRHRGRRRARPGAPSRRSRVPARGYGPRPASQSRDTAGRSDSIARPRRSARRSPRARRRPRASPAQDAAGAPASSSFRPVSLSRRFRAAATVMSSSRDRAIASVPLESST